jgi:hypothetical protein
MESKSSRGSLFRYFLIDKIFIEERGEKEREGERKREMKRERGYRERGGGRLHFLLKNH